MSLRNSARSYGVTSALAACLLACSPLAPGAVDPAPVEGSVTPQVIALAGADLLVQEGARVQLDGHASRSLVSGEEVRLSWSQLEGPAVTLTNATSPAPAFVAPLAPTQLRFRLRARAGVDESLDEVVVTVGDGPPALPLYVELPGDAARSDATHTIEVSLVGNEQEKSATLSVALRCGGQAAATIDNNRVILTGPLQSPCVMVVDAEGPSGRRAAPAAHVLWETMEGMVDATRLDAPVLVEAGTTVELDFDDPVGMTTRVWPTSSAAEALPAVIYGSRASFVAPQRVTRFVVGAERRSGAQSGGLRYALIDVSAGSGNRVPLACGGADRRVRPGGRFALAVEECIDPDGDPVEVRVTQALGAVAVEDDIQVGVFEAPEPPGTLLFVVEAFDGHVWSEPQTVRVVVDPTAINEPPVLEVEPERWVRPAMDFRLDADAAIDPDSGLIVAWTIAQDPEDATVLLPQAVAASTVELRAGQAGEVYHFRLSARDDDGGVAVADVTVVVEEAGPYVDRLTGDDETGNGTEAAPVQTIERALAIAARHRLPELRIAAGTQSELTDVVEGIGLRGGWTRTGDEWTVGTEHSVVSVGPGGAVLRDVEASSLSLSLAAADSILTLASAVTLVDVRVTEQPTHTGSLMAIGADAIVTLRDIEVQANSPATEEVAAVTVGRGADLRMEHGDIHGASGGHWVGVDCDAASINLVSTTIVGGVEAEEVTALRAEDCRVDITQSSLSGGDATLVATGIDARETALVVDEASRVVGLTAGQAVDASALRLVSTDAPALLRGQWLATTEGDAVVAVVLDIDSPRTEVRAANLVATAMEGAYGVVIRSSEFDAANTDVSVASTAGEAIGVELIDANDGFLRGAEINVEGAVAFGVRAAGASGVEGFRLEASAVTVRLLEGGAGIGLGASHSVNLKDVDVTVDAGGEASAARGIGLQDGELERVNVHVRGVGDLFGVVLSSGGAETTMERSALQVESDSGSALGLLGASQIELRSTVVSAAGFPGSGIDVRQATSLRHCSILASDIAVMAGSSLAMLSVSNTVLVGLTGLSQGPAAPVPALLAGVVFANANPWVSATGSIASSVPTLLARGCVDCLVVDDALLDENGRQLPVTPHPLRDTGLPAYALALDIDGDPIPLGGRPDIGADEFQP